MIKHLSKCFFLFLLLFLTSCESNHIIVNSVDEREANEIVVYLASKGVAAQKVQAPTSEIGGGGGPTQFNITVADDKITEAIALLNRVGLPRVQGTSLLQLFAKSGLMSSDREETIRYQAGLAEELKNTIRKIDGVIDADVQISFPPADTNLAPGAVPPKTTAAIYVKHQGILEDPNSHMETKIKRLVAGSVNGLNFEDVSVISDRSRFADIQLSSDGEVIGAKNIQDAYVNIWSMVMTKSSLGRFRFIFFLLIFLNLLFAATAGFLVYKFYPLWASQKKEKKEGDEPL